MATHSTAQGSDDKPVDGSAEPAPATRLDRASSGRASCRACKARIAKGDLRFGEVHDNPFNDKPTTYWFHLRCAATRRSTAALSQLETLNEGAAELIATARLGAAYPRLERLASRELAPSGRARCRACKALIPKGTARFALEIFDGGRFAPMGYIHQSCEVAYFGVAVDPTRLEHLPGLAADGGQGGTSPS